MAWHDTIVLFFFIPQAAKRTLRRRLTDAKAHEDLENLNDAIEAFDRAFKIFPEEVDPDLRHVVENCRSVWRELRAEAEKELAGVVDPRRVSDRQAQLEKLRALKQSRRGSPNALFLAAERVTAIEYDLGQELRAALAQRPRGEDLTESYRQVANSPGCDPALQTLAREQGAKPSP